MNNHPSGKAGRGKGRTEASALSDGRERERLLRAGRLLLQVQRGELSSASAVAELDRDGIAPNEAMIGLNLLLSRESLVARLEQVQRKVKRARPFVLQAVAGHLQDLEDALTGALVLDRLRRGKERLFDTYQMREDLELDF